LKTNLESTSTDYLKNQLLVFDGWIPHNRMSGGAILTINKNGIIDVAILDGLGDSKKIQVYSTNESEVFNNNLIDNWINVYKKDAAHSEIAVTWPNLLK
jgi:hypothetical protein